MHLCFRYFGCGLVAPESLGKMYVLDLGCGAGQDSYVLARLVGESGHVTGIDMTEEQVSIRIITSARNESISTERWMDWWIDT